MRKITTLLSVLSLFGAFTAQANDLLDGARWVVSVSEPRVEEANWSDMLDGTVANTDTWIVVPEQGPQNGQLDPNNQPPQTLIDFDKLVLIGEKIIDIVRNAKAVVNVKRDVVGVLPGGLTDWTATSGWKLPISRNVDITLYSLAGFKLASANLKVIANYAGSVKGHGKFLRNVTVVPSNIKVYMGHTVDVWTEFREPYNIAEASEDPIAALGFDIRYKASGIGSEKEGARDISVTGLGEITVSE